jgi:hypothetical protein
VQPDRLEVWFTTYPAHATEGVTMCEKYNGWTNWETWNLALWMGEMDGLSDIINEQAIKEVKEAFDDDTFDKWTATLALASYVEDVCLETFDSSCQCGASIDKMQGPLADAVQMYYQMIDWNEIAVHFIDEAAYELKINPSAIIV